MIAYRDFHQTRARPGFFGHGKDETTVTFDGAVEEANAWIAAEEVHVITIEPVQPPEGGSPSLRVWFERFDADSGKAV